VLPETVVKVGEPDSEPPILKVPELENVIWQPVVPVVIAPKTVNVPVVMLIISFLSVMVAAMVSEPVVRFPEFTFTVQTNPALGRGIFKRPVIVNVLVPLIVSVLLDVTFKNVSEAHCAFAILTVTVIPALILTSSAEVGTDAPPQVAVLLQLPETEAVLMAALLKCDENNRISAATIVICRILYFICFV
jgi:hypothetical protein